MNRVIHRPVKMEEHVLIKIQDSLAVVHQGGKGGDVVQKVFYIINGSFILSRWNI